MSNRFNLFGSFVAPYLVWPVILMIYNLPPMMCIRQEFMFLSMVIPGLNSPSKNIDVCLRPLINKLKHLQSSETLTHDVSRKQSFQMKTTLMYAINDLFVYDMVSGWSTQGKSAYSYYMKYSKVSILTNSNKCLLLLM